MNKMFQQDTTSSFISKMRQSHFIDWLSRNKFPSFENVRQDFIYPNWTIWVCLFFGKKQKTNFSTRIKVFCQ
jgi:hypothetical protein